MSEGIQNGAQFRLLTLMLGIPAQGKTLDESYVTVLAEQVRLSGLTKVAILSQDAVYDSKG